MDIPQVGQRVLFRPGRLSQLSSGDVKQRLAAIVCKVFTEADLNLRVFDENGNGYPQMRVRFRQPDEQGDSEAGYCEWPEHDSCTQKPAVQKKEQQKEGKP